MFIYHPSSLLLYVKASCLSVKQCNACKSKHIKPIDTECPFVISTDDSASVSNQNMDQNSVILQENVEETGAQSNISQDIGSKILSAIQSFDSRLSVMESKVAENAARLTTRASPSVATNESPCAATRHSTAQPSVVPSLEAMQASAQLQAKVDDRMSHLEGLPDVSSQLPGKFRSQRGGKEVVFCKRQVPWPHNHILTGNHRERISYDDLDVYQWVAGYAGIAKDEGDIDLKNTMLEHLIPLMEDAHDFSWTGSKAAHAVILTKMEDCKLDWDEA